MAYQEEIQPKIQSKTKTQTQILTPILKFAENQKQKEPVQEQDRPRNYSFGKEVYKDFLIRKQEIQKELDLGSEKFHMVGTIKEDGIKRKFVLETVIGFNKYLSSDLLRTVDFLIDMTEDPQRIFNNPRSQEEFIEAAYALKEENILVKDAFGLKNSFNKKYEFDGYLFYSSENNLLTYRRWDESSSNGEGLRDTSFSLDSLSSNLKQLNEKGLIEFDYDRVKELKEHYRNQFFNEGKERDLAYYRRIVEEEKKTNHPIFSINMESNLTKVVDSLSKKELLDYFPFSSRFDVNFLKNVLTRQFGD